MASILTTTPSEVFVDSSVLFAACLSARGSARDLIVLARSDRLHLYASHLVWQETERNLIAKAPHVLTFFESVRSAPTVRRVRTPDQLVREVARVVVAKDAAIVAGAVAANVDCLVSYDRKHLLRQAEVIQAEFGLVVVTPDEVIRALHPDRPF
jgi:predicted nucleic acid-binding protein